MRSGSPKSKTNNVVLDGTEDKTIRSAHYVLYVSNLTKNEEEKYDVTYCDETPSKETCGQCVLRYMCNFSEAPKLRG